MTRKSIVLVVLIAVSLLIVAGVAGAFPAGAPPTPAWQDKADPVAFFFIFKNKTNDPCDWFSYLYCYPALFN